MSTNKNNDHTEFFGLSLDEARRLVDQGHYGDAIQKLQKYSQLESRLSERAAILDLMGYCFLRLGWFEEAARAYTEYLKIYPRDHDGRFFLASAYASLKWTDEAITELKSILALDPTDVLARHDLALCYRDKGWLKESLEEMRKAHKHAINYGSIEEKEIIEISLNYIEEEIQNPNEDGDREIFLLLILLMTVAKRSKLKERKPVDRQ